MLNWKIKNNVISELLVDDTNLINPWGVETADSWSFFSLESGIGYRYKIIDQQSFLKGNVFQIRQHIRMNEGEWQIEVTEELTENKVIRSAKLICVKDSFFMDFVIRFRFKKEFFTDALIADQRLKHNASNVYHQYPVKETELIGKKYSLKVKIISCETQGRFIPFLYVRDHKNEWVVHARMLPKTSDKDIIKLCSKYFKTSPLPNMISKIILRNSKIKEYLWYHAEHTPYVSKIAKVFSPNAFPLVKLRSGQELKFKVELELYEK